MTEIRTSGVNGKSADDTAIGNLALAAHDRAKGHVGAREVM